MPDNSIRGSALGLALSLEVLDRADSRSLHLERYTLERQFNAFSVSMREQARIAAKEIVDRLIDDEASNRRGARPTIR